MGRKHFVLVRGAHHGAWCWFKTKHLLESAGHRVTAVDMTSAGISTVNADDVKTFDQYNQPLYNVLESLGDSDKVFPSLPSNHTRGSQLRRHVGGARIKKYPGKIHVAVYVAASMIFSDQAQGDVHGEVYKEFENDLRFSFANGVGTYPTSCWVVEETAKRAFYSSCFPKDVQLGMMLLRSSPIMTDDATTFTAKGYHSVPRVYIKTTLDNCIAPKFQDLFISRNRPKEVRTIEAGHSPFLSAPKDLMHVAGTYAS